MMCPNFETCEGEIEFVVSAEYAGEGVWNTFMGLVAECSEQTCSCVLTKKQWAALEKAAIEKEPNYD